MADSEPLDIVNEQDVVIGITDYDTHYSTPRAERPIIRAVAVFIERPDGKLWIPRRAVHKRIKPGALDFSACGHVTAGETYLESALREFKEECGIDAGAEELVEVGIDPPTPENPYFHMLYVYRGGVDPELDPQEFSERFWLSPEELLERIRSGEPAKDSLLPVTNMFMGRAV